MSTHLDVTLVQPGVRDPIHAVYIQGYQDRTADHPRRKEQDNDQRASTAALRVCGAAGAGDMGRMGMGKTLLLLLDTFKSVITFPIFTFHFTLI